MIRTILSVIAGIVAGGVVVALVEGAGHMVFPPPEGVDLKDPEALKTIMHDIPVAAKIAVLVAWCLGVFAGGSVAKLIGKSGSTSVWAVAVVFAIFTIANLFMIPHPGWMIAGAFVAIILGAIAANAVVKSDA